MNCAHCTAPMIGRKRMYCDKTCSNAAYAARPKPDCSADGCNNPSNAAKGLCKTHYNRLLPNRHRKATMRCGWCGVDVQKDASSANKFAAVYCSLAHRDHARAGMGEHVELPELHWARWYGATDELFVKACVGCGHTFATGNATKLRCSAGCYGKSELPRFTSGKCADCDAFYIAEAHGSPTSYCSRRCASRVSKRRRRAREHNAPGDFRYSQVMRQYQRQGNVCAYCRRPASGLPDPEHVVPLSRGGRNDMSNLVAACAACNTDKSDLTLNEWERSRAWRGLAPVDTTLAAVAYRHLALIEPTSPPYNQYAWTAA